MPVSVLTGLPITREEDAIGQILGGGLLYTFAANSDVPLATFTDIQCLVPNQNPVKFDVTARAFVRYLPQAYKLKLTGPESSLGAGDGTVMWTVDNYWPPLTAEPISLTALILSLISPQQTPAELAAGVVPVNTSYAPGDLRRYGADPTGVNDSSAALTSANLQGTQPGGAAILVNTGQYFIAFPLTVTAPIMFSGGTLSIIGGTLTISGPMSAGRTRIFSANSVVVLSKGSVATAFPEWWGAVADAGPAGTGTDSSAAFTAAITACSGGAALNIGIITLSLASGYYLTSNLVLTPAFTIRGVGRKTSGLVARNGTAGIWLTDNGNAAGIILQDFAMYGNSANCPLMTNNIVLGFGTSLHGSEGYLFGLWPRDCACSGGAFAVDIKANIGFYDLISVYGNGDATIPRAASPGSGLLRMQGVGNMLSHIVLIGAGSETYSLYLNGPGSVVHGLEIEAPLGCSANTAPLSIQANAYISSCLISMNNGANTLFDHIWEVGASATSWAVVGLQLTQASGSFKATVTNGNAYNIGKTSYFGGTLTTVAGNTQGSGSYTAATANALSGTVTFASATTAAVVLPWSQSVSTYKVQLSGNAAGFCWVTAKTASGFTINCSVSNSNATDWSVTL